MVAALSSSPSSGQESGQRDTGTIALAERITGNGEISRKQQRTREITSRYKSTTPSSIPTPSPATPARRYPSPVIGRSSNGAEGPKRSVSAERKRPDSPAASTSSSSSRPSTPRTVSRASSGSGNTEALRSSQRLWPSSHGLSSSLQLDHTLKPAENGIRRNLSSDKVSPDRKGTPERKRTPVRRPTTDQTENARPQDNPGIVKPDVYRWPGGNSPKAMSRSVDLSSDKDKSGKTPGLVVQGRALNGTARPVRRTPPIRSLSRSINDGPLPDSPQSVSRHMLSESRGRAKREFEGSAHSPGQESTQQQVDNSVRQVSDETDLASSEGQPSLETLSDCESLSSAGSGATTVTSSGSVKRAATVRSRRLSQGDILGCSLTEQEFSTLTAKNGRRLKSLCVSAGSPSTGMSPGRLPSQQPPSPSRMLVPSPFRSNPSPTRTRIPSFQLPPSGHSSRASSLSSLLHFPMDMRKGKKAMSQQEEAQCLRILHNRWLQWCFVNARAEAAKNSQKAITERSIYNAWLQTSELRKSVAMKRIKLQQARQAKKLQSILSSQGPQLESWASLQAEHSAALSGAMDALEAAVLRVPVTTGARADVQAIRDALGSAVDVMASVESSVINLMPKAEKMDGLISELAEVAKQGKATLEESGGLLDRIAALEIEETSLRTHFVQLESERSRSNTTNWVPTPLRTPGTTC